MVIIDFDDTLFDTEQFKEARLEAVEHLGVSEQEFWETYRIARNSPDGAFTYSNERHAAVLAERGYSEKEVLFVLEQTTGEHVYEFLFSDTIPFLDFLKHTRERMILLSLGNPGFQKLKTDGSGVSAYFDTVIMVHDTKRHVLRELLRAVPASDSVWFINDKVDETKQLLSLFPELRPILKQSRRFPESDYAESGLPYFETLTEIQEFLTPYVTP
ncbi:MAG TPA: hypothetical protein DCY48_00965 [Candidatus Magasanikbacteria bacterium]|nr:MAG: hypothetical protein A3I74_01945 [Candidatus Magasanikbacteria bacterium RIFCSPLOWO2_02_FULL_47_16]OGH79817.1 MAG: hypothetical protein A3C10_05145 [Candidatus Magasanikbacteria bacterium RIFCSPHIGHO2_02_FULL_48_18]OGH83039.1 MAG: hypothetical protein A3G08_01320 [Candidatus Magasanikbacteria bacterium RIFCSPLOWO2_12_FULL_47_9b]HAZ28331.1 hypothetical protein [Candidatus Magasanikbacteria bacterium]